MATTSPPMAPPSAQRKGSELEKFKRRMIRAVARRMMEKKSTDIWEDMKKEVGKNCQKLWERMRQLTLKKLRRLLEADDRVDLIGPVARMTVTDWLLFDLVIVHEKIDVIEREKLNGTYHSKVLENLFSLVQRFEIEGRVGDDLAEAWTAATVYYNSKGHQCSPMMLQRRWYQIKEFTRHKFYKFWSNYRGNARQLEQAKQDPPDQLQKAIALRYPGIVTSSFPDWQERIEQRLVILPDEFGPKMRQKNLMKASDVSAPDVVLIEPHIEVIDLGTNSDSDEESPAPTTSNTQPPPLVTIKSEPVEVDENFQIDETYTHPPEKGSEFDEEIERLQMVEERIFDNVDQDSRDVDTDAPNDEPLVINDGDENSKEAENDVVTIGQIANVVSNSTAEIVGDNAESPIVPSVSDEVEIVRNEVDEPLEESRIAEISSVASAGVKVENVNDVIERDGTADEAYTEVPELLPIISTVSSAGVKVEKELAVCDHMSLDVSMPVDINTSADNNTSSDSDIICVDNDTSIANNTYIEEPVDTVNFGRNNDIDEVSAAILAISNTCEGDMETEEIENETVPSEVPSQCENEPADSNVIPIEDDDIEILKNSEADKPSADVIDLGTFGDVPTDLTFADDGIQFADDDEDEDDIIIIRDPSKESKKEENDENNAEDSNADEDDEATNQLEAQKFDLKLLMCPVVYTTKLEAMTVYDDHSMYDQVYDKESLDKIYSLSKPISKRSVNNIEQVKRRDDGVFVKIEQDEQAPNNDNDSAANVSEDDLFHKDSDSDSNSDIDDTQRVKLSSYMLQKPKHRSYNPILLCKNPDFNTRLKRLSVGFFMSPRNRTLLQRCIPMTIDMSKAFENKLINGTLYLKNTPIDSVINIPDVDVSSTTSVKPSAVPVQSLMNIDDTLENELKKRMAERNRAINLPDISQVRRLNQHLLTAEVTPLRLQNEVAAQPSPIANTAKGLSSADYVQNIKNDIDNLLCQQKAIAVTNTTDSVIVGSVNTSLTPAPVIELSKTPAEELTQSFTKTSTEVLTGFTSKPTDVSQPAAANVNQPIVASINQPIVASVNQPIDVRVNQPIAASINQPIDASINQPIAAIINQPIAASINQPTAVSKKPDKVRKLPRRTYYPPLAWNSKNRYPKELGQTDTLLTIDTLYKMLDALGQTDNYLIQYKKKNKKQEKNVEVNKAKEGEPNKDTVEVIATEDIPNDQMNPEIIDITDDEVKSQSKKPKCKVKVISRNSYCCWSRYRIEFLKRAIKTRRQHKCGPITCDCCCKAELEREEENISWSKVTHNKGTLLHHFEIESGNCSENLAQPNSISQTTEHVVQTTITSKTMSDVSIQINLDENKSMPVSEISDAVATIDGSMVDCSQEESISAKPLVSMKSPEKVPVRVYTGAKRGKTIKGSLSQVNFKSYKPRLRRRRELNTDTTYPVQTLPITLEPPQQVDPCTCTNISSVQQGKIEIDCRKTCTQHKKVVKESKIYLTPKLLNEDQQPFFVGKGKILLTNMKMPKKDEDPKLVLPISQSEPTSELVPPTEQVTIPTLCLPAGVHIVLLADQTITYIKQDDAIVTPEEYATLPHILHALQQQINAAGITLPADHPVSMTDEIIDLDKDDATNEDKTNTETNTFCQTSSEVPEQRETSTISTLEITTEDNIPKENTTCHVDKDNNCASKTTSVKETTTQDTSEASEEPNAQTLTSEISGEKIETSNVRSDMPPPEKEENKSTEAKEQESDGDLANRKSLLSDLMEMSGIFEEDSSATLASPAEVPALGAISNQNTASLQEGVLFPAGSVPLLQSIPEPGLSALLTLKLAPKSDELSAVTSFAELKYASDNGGQFFKLDLESGKLTSINVCIQKFQKNQSTNKRGITEKTVIDLTDDPDIQISNETENEFSSSPEKTPVQQKLPNVAPATPSQVSTVLMKKQKLMERLSNNLKPVNILQSKRHVARILKRNKSLLRDPQFSFYSKRKIDRIEAKIDLVDSDSPMEEEYLVSDCDSSDDEPLMKKANRMRIEEAVASVVENKQQDNSNEQAGRSQEKVQDSGENENLDDHVQYKANKNIEDVSEPLNEQARSNESMDDETENTERLDEDMDLDEMIKASAPILTTLKPIPVPTNLVLSGDARSMHNIPLNQPFTGDADDESSQDDCILGV